MTRDEHSILQRLDNLEKKVGVTFSEPKLNSAKFRTLWVVSAVAAALYCDYRGLGLPNHPYQIVLGALTIALAYHRHWLELPQRKGGWIFPLLNAAALAFLFKLLIGSGIRFPFAWVRYPTFDLIKNSEKWLDVPHWTLLWVPSPIALWEFDFTILQTFLLIVTLIGALFRFQPFASITAIFLMLASFPAFSNFNWEWVFPALIATSVSLYAQSGKRVRD